MLEYIIGLIALLQIYKSFYFFLIRKRIKGPVKIMKNAEPFFIRRSKKKAALLIHGFTSSPREFRFLSSFLTKNNITVYAPLLPGHGTSPERLALTKYVQWIECVEENIKLLSREYKEIYLIGNSFGGNLALINATKSKNIKGIITLGTPIFFHREKINKYLVFPLLNRIKIFQKKRYSKHAKKIIKKSSTYMSIPLRSLNHFLKVVNLSKKNLSNIKVPILTIQTENDQVARKDSAQYILNNVKSNIKINFTVPSSYHVFILDKHAPLAFTEISNFINKY